MCHCKACNRILDNETLKSVKPDGKPEDMCSYCRSKCYVDYNILSDREYAHASLTGDSLTPREGYYYDFVDN